jgi:hypothetical protein
MICYTYKYTLFLMKKHVNNTIYIYTLTIYIYTMMMMMMTIINHQRSTTKGLFRLAR